MAKLHGFETVTNGETAEIADKTNFLSWMIEMSVPVPNSPEESQSLVKAWIKYLRKQGILA